MDNRLPPGIQPRVQPTREGLESSVMGTGIQQARLCAKAGVELLSEMGASIPPPPPSAGVLGLRQRGGEGEPPGPSGENLQ